MKTAILILTILFSSVAQANQNATDKALEACLKEEGLPICDGLQKAKKEATEVAEEYAREIIGMKYGKHLSSVLYVADCISKKKVEIKINKNNIFEASDKNIMWKVNFKW